MFDSRSSGAFAGSTRLKALVVAALTLAFLATTTSVAGATIRIINHTDPAGDPTLIPYHMEPAYGGNPPDFAVPDGTGTDFGGPAGTYVIEARPPAGWVVSHIDCVGPRNDFIVDIPGGRATINRVDPHADEQICAFTVSRVTRPGVAPGPAAGTTPPGSTTPPAAGRSPSSGVSAAPLPQDLPFVKLPPGPALVRVIGGLRSASATVRLQSRSVIRATLLRVAQELGTTRVVRAPGSHGVKVRLSERGRRLLRGLGQQRTILTLRIAVVEANKPARVFRFRVQVRLR
jgi:hypothetical protein